MTPEQIETAKFLWQVGITICSAVGAIGFLWLSSKFVLKKDFDEYKSDAGQNAAGHAARLTVVEQALIHAPKKEDISELSDQIGIIARELSELRGEQKSQNNLLSSIHDHLLNREKS